jgi:predicted Zn-dependent protease
MKKLNVKLVAVLVISTIVLSGATYAIHAVQVGNNADSLRTRGDEAKSLGKEAREDGRVVEAREHYVDALKNYSRYLIYRGDNDEYNIRVELANVYTDIAELPHRSGRDVMNAIAKLEETLTTHKEEHELRRRLAKYLMGFGRRRIKDAVEHWEQLAEHLPEDAEVRFELARCYHAQDNIPKAIESLNVVVGYDDKQKRFDRSTALAADMLNAYDLLAIILRKKSDNVALADRVIDEMIAANADDHNAYLHRAEYLRLFPKKGEEQDPRIEQNVRKAQALAATDANVLLAAADVERKSDKFLVAIDLLNQGKQLYPEDGRMYLQLARLYLGKRKIIEASEEIDQGLKKVPNHPKLLLMRAQTQLQKGELKGLLRTKEDLEKAGIRPALINYIDALSKVLEGKWFDAGQAFERGRRYWSSDSTQLRQMDRKLAHIYLQLEQPDLQLAAIRRVLEQGVDFGTLASEIQALISLGRTDAARAKLLTIKKQDEEAFYTNGNFWSRLLNIEKLRQLRRPKPERDWSLVDEIAGSVLKKMDENAVTLATSLAEAEKSKADPKAINAWRQRIESISVAMIQLKASVLESKEEKQAAEALLDAARKKFPDNYTLQKLALGRIGRVDGPAAALKKIDQMQAKFPAFALDLKLSRINLLVRQNNENTRAGLAKIEADVERLTSIGQKQAFWSALARAHGALRNSDETRRLMRLVADSDLDNPKHLMQQFEIARAYGDEDWMQEIVDDLKRRDIEGTGSSQLLYAQAALEVGRFKKSDKTDTTMLDRGREYLSQARIVRPDWHKLSQLVGEINHLEKNVNEAIKGYQLALAQGPADLDTINRIVGLLSGQRRYDDALKAINLLGDTRREPSIQKAKAEIYAATGKMKEAIEAAGFAVSDKSELSADHRWHGRILAKAGKLDEAEAAFRRAVEHGSNLPEPWLDLIGIQVANKHRGKAEESIREAQLRLPEDVSLTFLAQCYRLTGNQQLELQCHRENLRRNPDSLSAMRGLAQYYHDRRDAKQTKAMLYEMVLVDVPNTRNNYLQKKWARQLMARLLAVNGDYQQLKRGLKLIEMNAIGGKLLIDDQLLKARMLARRPEPGSRQQAIEIFERLKNPAPLPSPLTASDKLTMAKLYEREGKWLVCRGAMNGLLGAHPNQPALRVEYIQMLLRNGEAQQVEAQLIKLRKLPDMQITATRLEAMMLAKLNRGDEATAKLAAELQNLRPLNAKNLRILAGIAQLLVHLDQHTPAENLYRQYVKAVPNDKLVLANYLATHGKKVSQIDEAFEICDQAIKVNKANLQKANQIGLSAIVANNRVVTQRHFDQVKAWIDQAQRAAPDARAVQRQLAQYYDAIGEYRKSADAYTRLLENPTLKNSGTEEEAIVLNNLAYVLADKLKEAEGGLKRINRSISIMGPRGDLLDTRAMVYLRLDKSDEAIGDLKLALSDHAPGSMYMKYLHLAMAYQKADLIDEAQDALRKAINDGLKTKNLKKQGRQDYEELRRRLNFNEGEAE